MDPNVPQAPAPTPPAGPGPEGAPGWGMPTAPGPQGAPGWGMPEAPSWGAPAPAPSNPIASLFGSMAGKLLGIVVIIGIVIAGVFVMRMFSNDHTSQIVFTSQPVSEENCEISHTVTTVKLGDPVYANYFLKHRLNNEAASITVTKDGEAWGSLDLSAAEASYVDCLEGTADLSSDLDEPGKYHFVMTSAGGEILADGSITITAP